MKCHIREPGQPRCKGEVIGSIKVRVVHPSGRRTWQTWHLCETHAKSLLKAPQNWSSWKKHKGEIIQAPVMETRELILVTA